MGLIICLSLVQIVAELIESFKKIAILLLKLVQNVHSLEDYRRFA